MYNWFLGCIPHLDTWRYLAKQRAEELFSSLKCLSSLPVNEEDSRLWSWNGSGRDHLHQDPRALKRAKIKLVKSRLGRRSFQRATRKKNKIYENGGFPEHVTRWFQMSWQPVGFSEGNPNTYKHTIKMCPWKAKGLGTQQFPGTVEILEFFIHTTCQQTWTFTDSKVKHVMLKRATLSKCCG